MQNVIIHNVANDTSLLIAVMPNVIMLNVIMVSVVAPNFGGIEKSLEKKSLTRKKNYFFKVKIGWN